VSTVISDATVLVSLFRSFIVISINLNRGRHLNKSFTRVTTVIMCYIICYLNVVMGGGWSFRAYRCVSTQLYIFVCVHACAHACVCVRETISWIPEGVYCRKRCW